MNAAQAVKCYNMEDAGKGAPWLSGGNAGRLPKEGNGETNVSKMILILLVKLER